MTHSSAPEISTVSSTAAGDLYRQLIENGFCKFPGILPEPMLDRLRTVTARLLDQQAAGRSGQVSTGSMIPVTSDPFLAELIAYPKTLAALSLLGYSRPTFTDGYIISKPAFGPPLFWHYDWFAWENPQAYEPEPMQLFAMYYLSGTTRANGCLRVIPGTHYRQNPLHSLLAAPHSEDLALARTMEGNPAFSGRPDEVDVCVEAGDLLIGDARLLHAAHGNSTTEERTLITLWYQPDYAKLPEEVQAQMVGKIQVIPDDWPEASRALVQSLHPKCTHDVKAAARGLRPEIRPHF